MSNRSKRYSQEFKENAVKYKNEHPDLSISKAAKNLGVSASQLGEWLRISKSSNNNSVQSRGSGNYSSDAEKELARVKKELKDTQAALEVLKKAISILGN